MASLKLIDVTKIYKGNDKPAVDKFNMEINDGEFIVFVGPSGCGKSTTLRMIAGLEDISDGELYIDGEYMNDVEPKDRNLAMVFQNYALYPYLTVYENIAFGLRIRKLPKDEIDKKVHDVARVLGIEEYLDRKPKALSGGQRQRVALGRAIVRDARIYLFDEPLSNLDAKLRASMRVEIIRLYEKLKTTFIYVTHDQVEAMTMGTRIVVMKDGIVQQIDTPTNLYDYPVNKFVAGFIGTPPMNFISAKVMKKRTNYSVSLDLVANSNLDLGKLSFVEEYQEKKDFDVILGVRSEDIHFATKEEGIAATIRVIESLGSECLLYLSFVTDDSNDLIDNSQEVIMKIQGRTSYKNGDMVHISFDKERIHLFDKNTEKSVLIKNEKE